MTAHAEAMRLATAIRDNVDAMYDDSITFEQFHENQGRLWGEIEDADLHDAVCEIFNRKDS